MDAIARQLNKARRVLDAGDIQQAIAIARELTRKHSRDADALHFLGHTYCAAGKPSAALPYLRRAASVSPDDPQYRQTLAHALAEIGLIEEAIAIARQAVDLERQCGRPSADGHMLLGSLHCRSGSLADAEDCFAAALELLVGDPLSEETSATIAPQAAAAYNNLANVRAERGRHAEAVGSYLRAIGYVANYADAWTNLAATLMVVGQIDAAADAAQRAVALAPQQVAAWLTLGNALSELGRWTEARRAFDTLLARDPLSLPGRYNRSMARLALGEWSAWDDYRLRHGVEPTVGIVTGLPSWRGESLSGKTVLVRREQGIGTQIMFSGYLPDLANLAGNVHVECDPRLQRLFERTMPGIDFAPTDELFSIRGGSNAEDRSETVQWKIARPEVEVAIGDLPGLLRPANNVGDWTEGVTSPRLVADKGLFRKWRERLSRLGPGMCVGISWRGGGTTTARKKRSTTLDQWSPVFRESGVHFVSLQYGDCRREIAEHVRRGGPTMHSWDDFDPRDDLDDMTALVSALDLVVSIDNSTAHIAGAVGARSWVLLPAAADWRWQLDRGDTPWYPTVELLRLRASTEDWQALFTDVAARLNRLVDRRQNAASRVG